MAKNYYHILGLDPAATPEQIKSAYRQKVKEFHPDHFGEDCAPFLTIQEAYDVLSDPVRRQAYDARLARNRPRPDRPPAGSPVSPKSPVEPLIPHQEPDDFRGRRPNPSSPGYSSLLEELFGRPWGRDARSSHAGTLQGEPIEVEVPLSPAQARRGGRVEIVLPIESRCPACRGRGHLGSHLCRRCLGEGYWLEEYPLLLSFPPGIASYQTVDLSLDQVGLPNLYLRVHFVIRVF